MSKEPSTKVIYSNINTSQLDLEPIKARVAAATPGPWRGISLFLCVNIGAQNDVGAIISLKGTARVKPVKGKAVMLNEKNYARSLQPNEKLIVDKNGQLKIWLCNNEEFFIPTGIWYPISGNIICSPPVNSKKRQALEKRFSIGARHPLDRHRGENSFILIPIESNEIMDIIRPETAMFRWLPSTTIKLNLSVSVIGAEDEHWEKPDVSGEKGSFTSDDLRKFLKDAREKHSDARLQLKIKTLKYGKHGHISTFVRRR